MVFNRKDEFFLDLGSEGAKPAKIAIKAELAKTDPAKAIAGESSVAKAEATKAQSAQAAPSSQPAISGLTTAEAIAAQLRAAQEALPPPSNATFAPDCLNPANALPSRRRRAGANLGNFKDMAKGLFRN